MSHFECRLNRRFWRKKKWYNLSKFWGGGKVIWTKSKRTALFPQENVPKSLRHSSCWDLIDVTLVCEIIKPLKKSRNRSLPYFTEFCQTKPVGEVWSNFWVWSYVQILKLSPCFTFQINQSKRWCTLSGSSKSCIGEWGRRLNKETPSSFHVTSDTSVDLTKLANNKKIEWVSLSFYMWLWTPPLPHFICWDYK